MAVLAAPQLLHALRHDPTAPYYTVRWPVRLTYAVYYLGLAGFLALMTRQVHSVLAAASPA